MIPENQNVAVSRICFLPPLDKFRQLSRRAHINVSEITYLHKLLVSDHMILDRLPAAYPAGTTLVGGSGCQGNGRIGGVISGKHLTDVLAGADILGLQSRAFHVDEHRRLACSRAAVSTATACGKRKKYCCEHEQMHQLLHIRLLYLSSSVAFLRGEV